MKRLSMLLAIASCAASLACASVLGIPNDTASYCSTNTGHTYCEDFDLGDPVSRMTFHANLGGAQLSIAPSDDSPPSLLRLTSPALGPAQTSLGGYTKEFTSSGFGHLRVEADMRVVTGGKGFQGQAGFLLITDKQGGCIGLAMVPQGIGAVNLSNPYGCNSLLGAQGMGSNDAGGDAGSPAMMGTPLGSLPTLDEWVHIRADVAPNADGSGTLTFDVVGQPTGYKPMQIEAGTLPASGTPLVGFSVAALPGSSAVELQFDNITIDVSGP